MLINFSNETFHGLIKPESFKVALQKSLHRSLVGLRAERNLKQRRVKQKVIRFRRGRKINSILILKCLTLLPRPGGETCFICFYSMLVMFLFNDYFGYQICFAIASLIFTLNTICLLSIWRRIRQIYQIIK